LRVSLQNIWAVNPTSLAGDPCTGQEGNCEELVIEHFFSSF
jgi:hypothetical protein